MQTPDIRQAKVDALSQSVSSGEYEANAAATAGGIFASESI